MRITPICQWNIPPNEAVKIQTKLAEKVKQTSLPRPVRFIVGCDMSFSKDGKIGYAGVVVLEVSNKSENLFDISENSKKFSVVETATASAPITFPYIPGLLAFRELPPLIRAFERLKILPELIICDGQGIAHPRRFGIASHLGLLLDTPAIGCAKSILCGKHLKLSSERGAQTPLTDKGEIIGAILRTQDNKKPLVVSVGHKITLNEAILWTLALTPSHRITEPIRRAHTLVSQIRERKIRKDETSGGYAYNEKE